MRYPIEQKVYDTLREAWQADPQALTTDHVFHLIVRQEISPPWIVLMFNEKRAIMTLNGPDGRQNADCYVSIASQEFIEAKTLVSQVKDCLVNSLRFMVGAITEHPDQHDYETDLYGCLIEFSLWYTEAEEFEYPLAKRRTDQ